MSKAMKEALMLAGVLICCLVFVYVLIMRSGPMDRNARPFTYSSSGSIGAIIEKQEREKRESEMNPHSKRCWTAYDLKITVPFWCAEYMAEGRK